MVAANVIALGSLLRPAADVSFSFTTAPDLVPSVASTVPGDNAANVPVGTNVDINFSEPVTTSGSWYQIQCSVSGARTAVASGGPVNYSLDIAGTLEFLENCVVTLNGALIVDQDGTPDPMSSNFVFDFTTAASASNYYSSVNASNASTLRSTLHALIDDHIAYRYSIGTNTCNVSAPSVALCDVWDILEAADQDPANPNRVLDVYRNRSYQKITDRSGATGATTYNREHTWPNSLGFNDLSGVDSNNNPYSPYVDAHMLYASASDYNANRGNKPFDNCGAGTCAGTENPTDVNNGAGGGTGTYPGESNWQLGSDGNTGTYEVWRKRKGDMARAILYMDIRYEGGTHANGQAEPNLIVTNDRNQIVVTPSNQVPNEGYMGVLSTLIAWHLADPPDAQEQLRNEVVFLFQGNRNPFIDHPEWVACLWQNTCGAPGDDVFRNGFE
jgi:endonuclease I